MKNLKIINQNELKDWADEIFKKNSFNMVNVSSKNETFRRALASGKIYVGKEVFELIKNKEMPKGDPITLAEISAVLGVKKTSELIPLCHPLPIDHTATKIIMNNEDNSLEVFCVVSAVAKTGVEMEAIMGVNAALITIYDLSKIVNPHLKIDSIKLLIKEGGKSGLWKNPDGLPNFLKESEITFSTCSIFLTSQAIGNTSDLYLEVNSFATSFNNSSLLLVIITLAPNSKKYSTIDLPSPEPPPVTRITLSFRLFSLSIPFIK